MSFILSLGPENVVSPGPRMPPHGSHEIPRVDQLTWGTLSEPDYVAGNMATPAGVSGTETSCRLLPLQSFKLYYNYINSIRVIHDTGIDMELLAENLH